MTKRKMFRILHVLNSLERGGAESMLMNYYRNIDKTKIQFDFVVHEKNAGAYAEEVLSLGGRIFHVPKFYGYNLFSYLFAWRMIFKLHPEIYIVHGHMPSTAFIYLFLARIHGKYVIDHSHSVERNRSEQQLVHRLRYFIYWLTRYIPNRFFACSKEAGIDKYGLEIVNSSRFAIWHNAINVERFKYNIESRCMVREKMNIPADAKVIGHVGRFIDVKNHTFIIRTFAAYSKTHKDSILLLVGDGELRTKIELYAKKFSILDKVRFAGNVNNVEAYMSAMDIFLFPSKYEGLPVVTIEAQANGLPCLISKVVTKSIVVTKPALVSFLPINDELVWSKKVDEVFSDKGYKRDNKMKINNEYCIEWAAIWAERQYSNMQKSVCEKL